MRRFIIDGSGGGGICTVSILCIRRVREMLLHELEMSEEIGECEVEL